MKISTSTEIVKDLLIKYPKLRDDYCKLLSNYWGKESVKLGIDVSKISAYDFLKMVSYGKFANPESVTRARRKVQEIHPELRGKTYQHRKTDSVKDTLIDLKTI